MSLVLQYELSWKGKVILRTYMREEVRSTLEYSSVTVPEFLIFPVNLSLVFFVLARFHSRCPFVMKVWFTSLSRDCR